MQAPNHGGRKRGARPRRTDVRGCRAFTERFGRGFERDAARGRRAFRRVSLLGSRCPAASCSVVFARSRSHVLTSSRPHVLTSSRLHVFTSSRLHVFTSSRLHVFTSSRLHD
ncbi:hypothetical protein F4W02_18710 [Burkholderia pseudomallei]|nr:hypothetical protein [Burkholderia pseudomallei]